MGELANKMQGHGQGISKIGQMFAALNEGAQGRKRAYETSQNLMDAANRRMASATRESQEEQRRKEWMESKAISIAAMSGAGTDDPTIVKALGDLNAEGEYRTLSTLWVGIQDAEGLQLAAETARRDGEAALSAAYMKAAGIGGNAYIEGSFDSFFGKGKDATKGTKREERPKGYEKDRWGF